MTIRVLLADDQALIRAGYRMILNAEPDLEVVGEAVNGRDAVHVARTTRADVVLMDIRMPEVDGIAATRRIAADDNLAGVRVLATAWSALVTRRPKVTRRVTTTS